MKIKLKTVAKAEKTTKRVLKIAYDMLVYLAEKISGRLTSSFSNMNAIVFENR